MVKHLENLEGISYLKCSKNLLGFSAQADSTFLFHVLLELKIDFDIAIVDYQMRDDSKKELQYARNLAKIYNKNIFETKAPLFKNNFEANARAFRMDFFKNIIKVNNYQNLILANQLNDRLEWFLMQLSRGCALNSLLGFDAVTKCDDFNIIRPLFNISKDSVLNFLHKNNILYFVDESNENEVYLRNYFRKHFSNDLMKKYENGIRKSLNLLKNDYEILYGKNKILNLSNNIFYFKKHSTHLNLHNIDLCAKKLGYVISSKQRDEIVKSKYSCVIGSKVIIDNNIANIFVAKNDTKYKHTKDIREFFRIKKIPPKIRPLIELKDIARNYEISSF